MYFKAILVSGTRIVFCEIKLTQQTVFAHSQNTIFLNKMGNIQWFIVQILVKINTVQKIAKYQNHRKLFC